jgi:RNA polymerase sigma-70 factor (ECF subfamily)
VKDKSLAEDVFQDVFIKAYEKFSGFKGNSSERTWLIRITINTCKDYLKRAYSKRVVALEEAINCDMTKDTEDRLMKAESTEFIVDSILSLPAKYKEVLILYYYEQFSTMEIAKILTLPEATVRTRMKRARELLKTKINIDIEY